MPLQATSGAASYDAFGGGVPVVPNYIEEVFSTYLYQADGSSTQTINNGIDLSGKGGLVWIKSRSNATGNVLVDTVRGSPNVIQSNTANAQASWTNEFGSFSSTGFTVPYNTIYGETNFQTRTYVSWTFREQPKFFDIVTFSGNDTTKTLSHNLGSVPGSIIVKSLLANGNWRVWHRGLTSGNYAVLNSTAAQTTTGAATVFGNNSTTVDPTSTQFTVGSTICADGENYVAYLFAHNAGGFGLTGTDNVISCGTFTGDGATDTTVTLGYEPQWVMMKKSSGVGNWFMLDTMRRWNLTDNDAMLIANLSSAEGDFSGQYGNPTATGFVVSPDNIGSGTFIYVAIRRPMKVPTDGTKVFNTLAHTGDAGNIEVTGVGFPPDLLISKWRSGISGTQEAVFLDRLRGTGKGLFSDGTGSENSWEANVGPLGQDGVKTTTAQNAIINKTGDNNAWWFMKRAPSFFDEVCYTGTGSTHAEPHNLQKLPEMVICKSRGVTGGWLVGVNNAVGSKAGLFLNQTAANSGNFNASNDSTTGFDVEAYGANVSGRTYVAWLFATAAGVSKVGNYTGNGSTQTINCGFGAGGARFVLLKRIDDTGGWYVYDSVRGMTTVTDPYLFLNDTAAEVATLGSVTTVSTGFALNSTILAAINVSGGTYIFLAIA
jgi:hypothetical protein